MRGRQALRGEAIPQPLGTVVLPVLLAFLAYAGSLGNGFVWDDPIILDRQLTAFRSAADVLRPPRNIPQFSPDYYRPLTVASYLLDRAIGDRRPLVYHLSLVLAHAGASALLALLGLRMFAGMSGAALAAACAASLFAVHPVHTESVAWVAGRSDVLATLFLLGALLAHARPLRRTAHRIATGVLFLLALGAKETAVVGLPLLLGVDLLARAEHDAPAKIAVQRTARHRRSTLRFADCVAPALALLVYALLRRLALGGWVGDAPVDTAARRSLADLIAALGVYGLRLVWPVHLNAYIDTLPTGGLVLSLSVIAAAAIVGAGVWLARRGERRALFALAWIGLALAPSLAIVWRIPEAPVAERYLYLPSAGFCLLAGWLAAWLLTGATPARRAAVLAVLVVLLSAALAATVRRVRVWADNFSLWADTAAKSRVSGLPLRSLAAAHQLAGRFDEARRLFEAAMTKQNSATGWQTIHNNLGTLAMYEKDFAKAEKHYREALRFNPNAADTLFNLGLALFQAGGGNAAAAERALPFYLQAEKLSPLEADFQAALGQAYVARGENERAAWHLRRSLELGVRPETAASVRSFLKQLQSGPPEHGGP